LTSTWRETFLGWAQQPEHRLAVARALDEIDEALAGAGRAVVSVSGGKDSLCLAHLVRRRCPGAALFHWDYGPRLMPRELERELQACIRAIPGSGPVIIRQRQDYGERGVFNRAVFGVELPQLAAQGYEVLFTGLRAEESGRRRRRIAARSFVSVIPERWPLARWRWLDVWAYLVSHGIRYPAIYDRMAEIDGWDRVRLSVVVTHDH
jgi:3'-phosphoadenosine 5'-phosphosulfate sulfotransferase (PAPS reductase)/FAD synthetase